MSNYLHKDVDDWYTDPDIYEDDRKEDDPQFWVHVDEEIDAWRDEHWEDTCSTNN